MVVSAVVASSALLVGAVTFASIPSANRTIHGCYAPGAGEMPLSVVDDPGACGGTLLSWSQGAPGGALTLLPVPKRAYDSRTGGGPRTAVGGDRTISLSTNVPVGAAAALVSITAIATVDSGYLTAYKGGTTYGGGRSISWYETGQTLTTSAVSAVDTARQIKVRAGGATHFLIDVVGYYT